MMGVFIGIALHHVGNQSSCENRKLIFPRVFASRAGEIEAQKQCRNFKTKRMTFPISSRPRAEHLRSGKAGVKRTPPFPLSDACRTPSGKVSNTRWLANRELPPDSFVSISTFPGFQSMFVTTALVFIDTAFSGS